MGIERFEDMDVWRAARALVRDIYQMTSCGDFARDFGLRDQVRRAAVSIMCGVAEGFEHNGDKEFRRFLFIAKASAGEVRSLLYVAQDVGYIREENRESLVRQVASISRQLAGLIGYLDKSICANKAQ